MNRSICAVGMNEFPECARIAVNAWQKGYAEYEEILGKELFKNIFPEWEKAKANAMEPYFKGDKSKRAFAVNIDDIIAGFITCELDQNRKIGTICNNAIDPEFQGRGLGSDMYDFILEVFRMEGMTVAAVETMDEDAYIPARKAYEKAGFNKILKRMTYYREL